MNEKYFDSLGNELYPVTLSDNVKYSTNKDIKSFIYGSINYSPYDNRYDFFKNIINSSIKPINKWNVERDDSNDLMINITCSDYPCAKTEDGTIITNTLTYVLEHAAHNYYFKGRIICSNSYNEETQNNYYISIWQGAVSNLVKLLVLEQYGIIVLDTDSNILGISYMLLGYNILNDGSISNCHPLGEGYNIDGFGGYTQVWDNIQIYPLDYEIKNFDNSQNTSIGGGYGLGANSTDSIDVPHLPNLNINVAGSALYNLSNAQMSAFSTYLWTSDWQDNIKKLRTDPMQNIIGVSVTDISLSGSNTTIKLGNLNTEISANLVSNWVTVDCGEIELNEYYGSFADYEPYIALTLYLPKVGFVQIPADAVVNNAIKVVYNIELGSGEGICFVYITNKRDGFSYVYNTYTCHVTANVALSASDHTQQLSALINAGINSTAAIAGAIATGGATSGNAAMTIATSALDVATTKNPTVTTGNIGNMGSMMCVKKPYLMINRTNLTKPTSFRENNGQLINYTAKISGHIGFLKTRDFHAEFDAPFSHKAEIERMMDEGVFING